MTWNTPPPVSFGKFFGLFQLYCNHCQMRGQMNDLQFFSLTSRVFFESKKLWEVNKWDLKELEEICGNIHQHDSAYDPSNFITNPYAYVLHVKNCYYLDI